MPLRPRDSTTRTARTSEDADRGLVASLEPAVVTSNGRVVWDNDAWRFLEAPCPPTANPSLWRQGQLCSRQGPFQVTDGIYQVRGLDLSNMTLIEGERGVIVVDPLISVETASAALDLYRRHRGDRRVTGVIHTHSHIDHFGGIDGVLPAEEVPGLAPEGFLEHAVSENVFAGTAMLRRAIYMYGASLPKGPTGNIGTGLGQTQSTGTVSLRAPTVDITHTGQVETVDGVRFEFQVTPDTEAPAEMNFLVPERRALCMAENATHNLHNVLTLRGTQVRDTHTWARYLDEAILRFGDRADVLFASHHWPTWGRDRIGTFLAEQRDLYTYLHDQTLRLINQGYTGVEMAEMIELPPRLAHAWHARGYYGSLSHNVKAIYQRYMGWFDGHPSSLWEYPPEESARRYVDCMGGVQSVIAKAREYLEAGDARFVAQLLKHAVFAEPGNSEAKELLATAYERLGFEAECGPWRNFYLTGAQELRGNAAPDSQPLELRGVGTGLTVDQVFDSLAIRVNGPQAAMDEGFSIAWDIADLGERHRMTLSNGALSHSRVPSGTDAGLSVRLTKQQLLEFAGGAKVPPTSTSGDPGILDRLRTLLDVPDPGFAIVTP